MARYVDVKNGDSIINYDGKWKGVKEPNEMSYNDYLLERKQIVSKENIATTEEDFAKIDSEMIELKNKYFTIEQRRGYSRWTMKTK